MRESLISRFKRNARLITCSISTLALMGVASISHAQIEGLPEIGEVVWEDNFDSLDTNIWTIDQGDGCQYGPDLCGWGNFELQWYAPENVSIQPIAGEDGNNGLVLQAIREDHDSGNSFTSGKLTSANKISFKYGVLEARMKVPSVDTGLWPAWWMLGTSSDLWPQRGEVDMMEMGNRAEERARQGHEGSDVDSYVGSNLIFFASDACSDANPTCAASIAYDVDYNKPYVAEDPLADRFVTYRLYWTADLMAFTIVDEGVETMLYEAPFPVADGDTAVFRTPFYMLLNLAVGGNFTDAPSPADVTAPLPASMVVDYVRVYEADGQGEVILGDLSNLESGPFGVYTETTAVDTNLQLDVDSGFYIWDAFGAVDGTTTPYEGDWAINLAYEATPDWFGSGIAAYTPRNMLNYADGELRFAVKIDADVPFRVGIIDIYDNQNWVSFPAGVDQFGLVRDGEWGEVVIPISLLAGTNVALAEMNYMFAITSDGALEGDIEYAVDNIVWYDEAGGLDSDGDGVPDAYDQCPDTIAGVVVDEAGCEIIVLDPESGTFGVYTETTPVDNGLQLGVNADLYFWDSGFVGGTTPAYEGDWAINIAYPENPAWFGNGVASWEARDMSLFGDGVMQFWIKVPADLSFEIGILDKHTNQNWVKFPANQTAFGLERNGEWSQATIPIAQLRGTLIDLQSMDYLFAIRFDSENPPTGPFELAIDDIVWIEELITDADGDGVLDEDDQCPDTPEGSAVDEIGCAVVLSEGVQTGTVTIKSKGHKYHHRGKWQKVKFDEPFDVTPVVVVGSPTANDDSPAIVSVRKVTKRGFEVQLDEFDARGNYWGGRWGRGKHGSEETITYIAAVPGVHSWGDVQFVAGETNADVDWKAVDLAAGFADAPVVMAQHVSKFDIEPNTTRIRNITGTSFEATLQYSERTEAKMERLANRFGGRFDRHSDRLDRLKGSIHYIALTKNATGAVGNLAVLTGSAEVTDAWAAVEFADQETDELGFMAGMLTAEEEDTATVRYQSLSATGVEVMIEEETSLDGEITHAAEEVGFVVLKVVE